MSSPRPLPTLAVRTGHPVVHLELHTGDPSGAGDLYADLCGWRPQTVDTVSGSYVSLQLGGRLGGGIAPSAVRRPMWLPYVEVSDVAAATEGARAAGAVVLLEPREGPTGWRSVVATAAGGEIAFWQPKPLPQVPDSCG